MNIYKTSDLAFAAFAVMRGLNLVKAEKETGGKFLFELEDPDNKAGSLMLEFVSSEFAQFDSNVRALKKMLYSN